MELKLTNCTKLQHLVQANSKNKTMKNEESMSLEERAQDSHQPADMIEPTQPQVDLAELYDELDSSPPAKIVKTFKRQNVDGESSDDPITAREIEIKRELD